MLTYDIYIDSGMLTYEKHAAIIDENDENDKNADADDNEDDDEEGFCPNFVVDMGTQFIPPMLTSAEGTWHSTIL